MLAHAPDFGSDPELPSCSFMVSNSSGCFPSCGLCV